jgi:hypothetical protein
MSIEQPKKEKEIKITVDNEQTKLLSNELARKNLQYEHVVSVNEHLAERLAEREVKDDHSDLDSKKLQVYERFHDSRALDCSTTEELRDLVTAIIDSRAPRQTPAGSAPMNPQQMGQSDDLYRRKFSSDKEMVDAILADMHGSDPKKAEIAKSYYDSLLGQWVKSKRQTQGLDPFYDPNRVENLPALKDVNGFKVPVDKDEGDIGRIMKNFRNEAKRKREEGAQ